MSEFDGRIDASAWSPPSPVRRGHDRPFPVPFLIVFGALVVVLYEDGRVALCLLNSTIDPHKNKRVTP